MISVLRCEKEELKSKMKSLEQQVAEVNNRPSSKKRINTESVAQNNSLYNLNNLKRTVNFSGLRQQAHRRK